MAELITLARPYAKAAFEFAKCRKKLEQWSSFLLALKQSMSFKQVRSLLENPSLTQPERLSILSGLVSDWNVEGGENFMSLISQRGRLAVLPEVSELFESYKADLEQKIKVSVSTASELEPAEQKLLISKLKKKFKQEVQVSFGLKPEIIGGFLIKANDLVIDASLLGKLNKLQDSLIA